MLLTALYLTLIVALAVLVGAVWCCCAVAGRADREIEALLRATRRRDNLDAEVDDDAA